LRPATDSYALTDDDRLRAEIMQRIVCDFSIDIDQNPAGRPPVYRPRHSSQCWAKAQTGRACQRLLLRPSWCNLPEFIIIVLLLELTPGPNMAYLVAGPGQKSVRRCLPLALVLVAVWLAWSTRRV
jgi:hypothetical protein